MRLESSRDATIVSPLGLGWPPCAHWAQKDPFGYSLRQYLRPLLFLALLAGTTDDGKKSSNSRRISIRRRRFGEPATKSSLVGVQLKGFEAHGLVSRAAPGVYWSRRCRQG